MKQRSLIASFVMCGSLISSSAPPLAAGPTQEARVTTAEGADPTALAGLGFSAGAAALLAPSTKIITSDEQQIHFVQTYPGGATRDVVMKVRPSQPDRRKLPMEIETGDVVLAESTDIKSKSDGYVATFNYFIPAAALGPTTAETPPASEPSPGGGPSDTAIERRIQAPAGGLSFTLSEAVSGGSGMVTAVTGLLNSNVGIAGLAGLNVYQLTQSPQVNGAAPTTTLGRIGNGASAAFTIGKQGASIYGMQQKFATMRDQLRAMKKCAENPTNPLAKNAQQTDPNYRKSTSDVLDTAERDLTFNTTIKMVASTGNGVASALLSSPGVPLGKQLTKAVSILDQVEQKMLDDVAEKYIMPDAGKGVVPCEPDCAPVYQPPAPTAAVASFPAASLSCEPRPEELICSAGPAKSSQPARPPSPNRQGPVCTTLTSATFIWKQSHAVRECVPGVGCTLGNNDAYFAGIVSLQPTGEGYVGTGPGTYGEVHDNQGELFLPGMGACNWTRTQSATHGSGALSITLRTRNGGEADIRADSKTLHDEQNTTAACTAPNSWSIEDQVLGLGCQIQHVDLHRAGTYVTVRDRETNGTCTLIVR